jgi:hypothetical protein
MIYTDGSNIATTELPNYKTKSACMNEGKQQKAIIEAEDKNFTVRYRCILKQ